MASWFLTVVITHVEDVFPLQGKVVLSTVLIFQNISPSSITLTKG